jgi:hypothetical protein
MVASKHVMVAPQDAPSHGLPSLTLCPRIWDSLEGHDRFRVEPRSSGGTHFFECGLEQGGLFCITASGMKLFECPHECPRHSDDSGGDGNAFPLEPERMSVTVPFFAQRRKRQQCRVWRFERFDGPSQLPEVHGLRLNRQSARTDGNEAGGKVRGPLEFALCYG